MRRRELLAGLAVTAAAAAGTSTREVGQPPAGELLVARVRATMLGTSSTPGLPATRPHVEAELVRAARDFDACRYGQLAIRLPRLLTAGHELAVDGSAFAHTALARTYLLTTGMLTKLHEQQLGWMAADRARTLAEVGGDPLGVAEAARSLAVLARRAGWYQEATDVALGAADQPGLRAAGRSGAAIRGLLVQSAAYTAAKAGDHSSMRHLTEETAAMARHLQGALRGHGGGFSPATVALYKISAETSLGHPDAALATARGLPVGSLPTAERRCRYHTDVATALAQLGRREECVQALLAAEHHAPEETHARPAVQTLVSGLLTSGRVSPDLRGLAARCGIR